MSTTNIIRKIYDDGSGAPAVVEVQGWKFALDFLGEVRCHLVTQSYSRKPPMWAAEQAKKTYLAELQAKASPGWFALSRILYGT